MTHQRTDRQEQEEEDSSADLEGLIAELDDLPADGDEDAAFKKYWTDAMEADRELVKKIVKGGFKSSILLRQQKDQERDRIDRVVSTHQSRRLATLKKKLEEVRSLAVDHSNKEQKYKLLLGIEEEEIEGELQQLQEQSGQPDKPRRVRATHQLTDTSFEKERRKAVLDRLKIVDANAPAAKPAQRRPLESAFNKIASNEHLLKVMQGIEDSKKTQAGSGQLFLFRKKQA